MNNTDFVQQPILLCFEPTLHEFVPYHAIMSLDDHLRHVLPILLHTLYITWLVRAASLPFSLLAGSGTEPRD